MQGFAQIPKGAKGLCTNTFDFTGVAGQTSYAVNLPGPREGPFTLSAAPDVTSWSQCGGTTSIMNMNTQCNISPTQQAALIAVRHHQTFLLTRSLLFLDEMYLLTLLHNRSIVSLASSPSTSRLPGESARWADPDTTSTSIVDFSVLKFSMECIQVMLVAVMMGRGSFQKFPPHFNFFKKSYICTRSHLTISSPLYIPSLG